MSVVKAQKEIFWLSHQLILQGSPHPCLRWSYFISESLSKLKLESHFSCERMSKGNEMKLKIGVSRALDDSFYSRFREYCFPLQEKCKSWTPSMTLEGDSRSAAFQTFPLPPRGLQLQLLPSCWISGSLFFTTLYTLKYGQKALSLDSISIV